MMTPGYNFHSVSVTSRGQLQVKLNDATKDAGNDFHRYVLDPGDDLTNEYPEVIAAAEESWTPEVLAAWDLQQQAAMIMMAARAGPRK